MPCIMRANSSLKPDRDLLNTHFEGYKFTATSHTVNITALPGTIHRTREKGYNYQLTKRACLFNHLTHHQGTCYFVCRRQEEGLAVYSLTNGELKEQHVFPDVTLKADVSLFHCRDQLYLNVGTFLYVLKRKAEGWEIALKHDLEHHFMLLKVVEEDGGGVLVVTCTKDRGYIHHFYHCNGAGLDLFHTIDCSGIASLVSLKGSQLTMAVEGHLTTQETVQLEEPQPEIKVRKEQVYTWSQTIEDVEVVVPLPKGIIKSDLRVEIGAQSVEVTTKGNQELFEGTLFNKIEPQDSVWQLSDDKTSVTLHLNKYQEAHNWSSLLRNEEQKETSNENEQYPVLNDISDLDPTALDNMMNRIRSLDQFTSDTVDTSPYHTAHNDVEEIDEMQGSPLSLLTYQISDSTVVSDRVMELAPGTLLFTIPQPIGESIVVSHNVDALIYNSVRGIWTHTETLHAFTHIQASKTQKKFMIAPSDGSYAAIVDTSRNIFIYRSTDTNNGKLTVLGLADDSEIIGSVALSKSVILLTQQNIITVQFEF